MPRPLPETGVFDICRYCLGEHDEANVFESKLFELTEEREGFMSELDGLFEKLSDCAVLFRPYLSAVARHHIRELRKQSRSLEKTDRESSLVDYGHLVWEATEFVDRLKETDLPILLDSGSKANLITFLTRLAPQHLNAIRFIDLIESLTTTVRPGDKSVLFLLVEDCEPI